MTRIRVKLDEETKEEVKKRSEEEGISVSEMARQLIGDGIECESVREECEQLRQELLQAQETEGGEKEERIEELEAEIREVRKERDRLEGRLKAREETLEDMREFRNNAVGSFAEVAGQIGGGELTEEGVIVTDGGASESNGETEIETVEEDSGGWWIF